MLSSSARSTGAASLRVRALLALRYQIDLLRGEVAVGSVDLTRVSLVVLALGLSTVALFSPGHFRPATNAFFAILVTLSTLGGLLACGLATVPAISSLRPDRRRVLSITGLLMLSVLTGVGLWQTTGVVTAMVTGTPYGNDGAVMDLYAAQQLRHGHDPYARTNIVKALAAIDAPATTTTPLMRGQFRGVRAYPSEGAIQQAFYNVMRLQPRTIPVEFESKYNYPAGSFLFILPFVWAGIHDMRFLYLLAIFLMGAFIWRRMPPGMRILVPFLLVANVPLVVLSRGGQPDPLYGLFLMVGLAEWRSPRLGPAAMGIAVATKQLAWFFLPFYAVLLWREVGPRAALQRMSLVLGIGALVNLPFFIASPSAFISSVGGPMTDPMFPLGIGVIALFVANVVPMVPKIAFTVAEVLAWVVPWLAFTRTQYLRPAAIAMLGALPLFFAWRSLVNYFYLVPMLALAMLLTEARQESCEA